MLEFAAMANELAEAYEDSRHKLVSLERALANLDAANLALEESRARFDSVRAEANEAHAKLGVLVERFRIATQGRTSV